MFCTYNCVCICAYLILCIEAMRKQLPGDLSLSLLSDVRNQRLELINGFHNSLIKNLKHLRLVVSETLKMMRIQCDSVRIITKVSWRSMLCLIFVFSRSE